MTASMTAPVGPRMTIFNFNNVLTDVAQHRHMIFKHNSLVFLLYSTKYDYDYNAEN